MKNLIFPALLLAALAAAGCGTISETPANTSKTEAATRTTEANAVSPAMGNTASQPPGNSAVSQPDGETAANNTANNVDSIRSARMGRMGSFQGSSAPQSGAAPQPYSHPAPDDSSYSVSLADEALETRTFNSNPVLLKVEKRSNGANSSIKIYLRDGKTIDLPGSKITNMPTATAQEFLAAAGLSKGSGSGQQAAAPRREKTKP